MPSNESRGYTLRRIIRRAIRHGNKLGADGAFFHKLVASLVRIMGGAYPELIAGQVQIEKILLQEEQQFAKTLDKGMRLLEQDIAELQGTVISGNTVFTLYDTYGFPVDLTNDIARERGLSLDYEGFDKEMEAQRERARSASKFGVDYNESSVIQGETQFVGYEVLDGESRITGTLKEGEAAPLEEGDKGVILLDVTPFYAESGGQAGDTGFISSGTATFRVEDTQKQGKQFVHVGQVVSGSFASGDSVSCAVDKASRDATALNHSATHLLHAALRKVLGEHVVQKGSLVNNDRLRFDFAHYEAVTKEQITELERIVNQEIRMNTPVSTTLTDMDSARKMGAMALFGEKYGDEVRVLSMGQDNFSVELCGGTHVQRTGDIGQFVILSEGGISSGVRRIEAVTGIGAEEYVRTNLQSVFGIASQLKCSKDDVLEKTLQQVERIKQLEKELDKLKAKLAADAGSEIADSAVEVNGVKVIAKSIDGMDRKGLMDAVDKLKNELGEAVVMLASVEEGKVVLIAGVTKSICKQYPAGDLMKVVAAQIDGKGGGRPDMAQGGGSNIEGLEAALAGVQDWVAAKV
jgi:alanyl-tRNA synthetase